MYLRPATEVNHPYADQLVSIDTVLPSPWVREMQAEGEAKAKRVENLEEYQWDVDSPREGTHEERKKELKEWHKKI